MADIITELRPYFFATKVYFERYPGKARGSEEAMNFLYNYAQTLPTKRSTIALLNFAKKELKRHATRT